MKSKILMDIASDHVYIKICTPIRGKGVLYSLQKIGAQLLERQSTHYQTVASFSVVYPSGQLRLDGALRSAIEVALDRISELHLRKQDFCLEVEVGASLSRTGVLQYASARRSTPKQLRTVATSWAEQRWNIVPEQWVVSVARTDQKDSASLLVTCLDKELRQDIESLCALKSLPFTLFRSALSGRMLRTMRAKLPTHFLMVYCETIERRGDLRGIQARASVEPSALGGQVDKVVEFVEFLDGQPHAVVRLRVEQPNNTEFIQKAAHRFADSRKVAGTQLVKFDYWPHAEANRGLLVP